MAHDDPHDGGDGPHPDGRGGEDAAGLPPDESAELLNSIDGLLRDKRRGFKGAPEPTPAPTPEPAPPAQPKLGRTVDPDSGEVRDPARAAYRRRYLAVGVDPDAPLLLPEYPRVEKPGGLWETLARVKAPILEDIANGLIERTGRYARLAELRIAYLWAADLGSREGEPRLWRWKKPDPLTAWALGTGRNPRAYDLILEADATVATRAQMTLWQAQALVHTAIECVSVFPGGRIKLAPESGRVQVFITARYGQWNGTLMSIARALAVAETYQQPLWDESEAE